MKRLIIILMLIAMVLNISACKRDISDETAEPIVEIDVPKTETETKNEVKTETKTETVTETAPKEEKEPEVANDKAEPCTLTTENVFSPNEVVITLTLEESAKGKVYRPEDFPEIDCYNVFPYNYYPEEYHPEHKDRLTLALMLNEPSKEKVLEYVKIAEKDDRVYSACPNALELQNEMLIVCADKKDGKYTKEDFDSLFIDVLHDNFEFIFNPFCYETPDTVMLMVRYNEDRYSNQKEFITELIKDSRIRYIMPHMYYFIEDSLNVITKKGEEFHVEDYNLKNVTVKSVTKMEALEEYGYSYTLCFTNPSKQAVMDTKALLEKSPEIATVEFNVIVKPMP